MARNPYLAVGEPARRWARRLMPKRDLPNELASTVAPATGPALSAPSALRNREALTGLLARIAPPAGRALELASGTGEHVVSFARALPALTWQPTDLDPTRLASIDAHRAAAGLDNLRPAQSLDLTQPGWGARIGGHDLVFLSNLLHLVSDDEAAVILAEAAAATAPGGRLVIYGPFMRAGHLTSPGDARFHAGLQASDPAIGYKEADWVAEQLGRLGPVRRIEMPANNLALIVQRPAV